VKARKVGTFPKQPPFYGPLRAIVKTAPPSEEVDCAPFNSGGFARKRSAPDQAAGVGSLSLLERVTLMDHEISDLRATVISQAARISKLERLVGAHVQDYAEDSSPPDAAAEFETAVGDV
jgi:hypothetical protein